MTIPALTERMERKDRISRRSVATCLAAGLLAAPSFMRSAFALPPGIVPFRHVARDEALADLKQRLRNTRLPEGETVSDWSQGVQHGLSVFFTLDDDVFHTYSAYARGT